MRITGGSLKGKPLLRPKHIRPTREMVRQAMFDVLQDGVSGARILDAYAGTGALGIEALSRGAGHADVVESDRRVLPILRKNIIGLGLEGVTTIYPMTVQAFQKKAPGAYDVIFADPPYDDYPHKALSGLLPLLKATGVLVYEHSSRIDPPFFENWAADPPRLYGDSGVTIYRRA